ncbi:outer membrane porin, OprD family [Pseudomonas pohangensis]|uniref:Outer membrane porin, OprD family n=1 Tax=Pseudomonas pohangensis TaxID=364197 RepID=A0A1H2GHC1_9PSED|nr:OprD family porin [Pseudomonas pohangensis]SDU18899.1 outer membrane porin, OprD family [Pseudomonas pohangensis]
MRINPLSRAVTLAVLGCGLSMPMLAHAEFIKDSKGTIELRNFYMNRDYRQDAPQVPIKGKPGDTKAYSAEWAQGFLVRLESGFTEGPVGFGVDGLGLVGVRLDSGRGRSGTGLLPSSNETGEAPSEYASLGATGKMRISKSVLKGGTLQLKNPAVGSNDSRLLPQTFLGTHGNMLEIEGLDFNAGQLEKVKQRDSTDNQDLTLNGKPLESSDHFQFAGGTYALTKELSLAYYYSKLEDIYSQNFGGIIYTLPLADGQFIKADLRYAKSDDTGDNKAGSLDNKSANGMLSYGIGAHTFSAAYQQMNGDNAFAYIGGTDPYLVNYVQIGDFAGIDEKSWQARYDLNFASYGIPGLSLMTRYVNGDNIDRGSNVSEGEEWERDTDIAYAFQDEALKGLAVKWRNATYRSNLNKGTKDLDENRLIISYTTALW